MLVLYVDGDDGDSNVPKHEKNSGRPGNVQLSKLLLLLLLPAHVLAQKSCVKAVA